MKRVALYVRVSTEEQKSHGLSVDNQIVALTKYCEDNNYIIAGTYNDAGISARKRYTNRPALLKLLDDCKTGKIDLIIFTKLDRWFRSVGDYYEVQRVLDECKVPWRTIWEDYETETSAGIFKVNIMLSVAQSEADRTSERIKATMAYKKERGDYLGSAPKGYIVRGGELLKDPKIKDGMDAFFDKYLKTFSIMKSIQVATNYGLFVNRRHMLRLLRNPVYSGETKQGYKCEPYITKEQHALIIENLNKHPRETKYPKRTYIFSGLCLCGYCGHRMASKTYIKKNNNGTTSLYKRYICVYNEDMKTRCPGVQLSEAPLEQFLLDSLDNLLEDYRIQVDSINSKIDNSGEKRKKELEAKLKRLANLYAEGDISEEDYHNKRDKVKIELNNIIIEPLKEPPVLPDNWKDIYAQLDDEHKRSFWLNIIKSVTITKENKKNLDVEFL